MLDYRMTNKKEYLIYDEYEDSAHVRGTEEDIISEANEYYHFHFETEPDYEPDFKLTTIEEALDFWITNGFSTYEVRELIQKLNGN